LISTHIALLEAGKSFGELALLHNKQRAASIKVVEDCYFATMDSSKQFSFDSMIYSYLEIKLDLLFTTRVSIIFSRLIW
jgi:hypothetical protein